MSAILDHNNFRRGQWTTNTVVKKKQRGCERPLLCNLLPFRFMKTRNAFSRRRVNIEVTIVWIKLIFPLRLPRTKIGRKKRLKIKSD